MPNKFSVLFGMVLVTCFAQNVAAQVLPLPRFVSLSRGEVNMRTGPGDRFPIKWVYQERHYPVEIIDEYELWRQIREMDGTTGWVHRRMLSGDRYVVMKNEGTVLQKPENGAKTIAIAQKGTIGKIDKCPGETRYCQIEFMYNERTIDGWVHRDSFFGVYPNEIIK